MLSTKSWACASISKSVVILLSVEEYACPVLPSFKKVGWQVESGPEVHRSLSKSLRDTRVDGTPVVPNVDNPEPVTLYHGASRKLRAAIAASIRILMNQHHFPLPQIGPMSNWPMKLLANLLI
ncbi:hypothetical protein TIFTF001_043456 [Ficus carica]|uniref:Uncharacterized protein n=1 Tax=Ficus carica TaxID=3494 RepID=A0AA88CMG6_FICCA|nr:hypothetical protein TIFTF001_043456 [Ficus carica]